MNANSIKNGQMRRTLVAWRRLLDNGSIPELPESSPMSDGDSFDELMKRLRAGEQAAAGEIFNRFARRLIGLARSRLDERMRQKVDPEDVMQSVFKSFFRVHADGKLDLANWDSMWAILTVITLRKCGHRVEYFRAACRDIGREVTPRQSSDESTASFQAIARDPTPSDAALLTETVEQVLRELEPREQEVVMLSLQGYAVPEISERVARTERTVHRVLKRVREKLEKMQGEMG
jgi:RNA polymerase sigma-70 factor (ECF subfamily)